MESPSPRLPGDEETPRQLLLRWTGATLCVAAMHAGSVLALANWPQTQPPAGDPPAAVMVELAPTPVAPEAPPQEVAVGPQLDTSTDSTPTDAKEEPEETPPDPPVEPTKTETPPEPVKTPIEQLVQAESEVPELPQNERAEAVLQAPAPTPPEPEKKPEEEKKSEKKPEKVEREKPKPKPKPKSVAQAASAPKPTEAARAKVNAAPSSGTASAASIATWRGTVVAHLNRLKRAPGGSRGITIVAFTIDRNGRVLSARIARSSGNAPLDREALAMVRRASPVPPPPANIRGNSILLSVPVSISR